jgi:hypothetical protein
MLKDKLEICFPESDAELDLLTLPFKSTYRVLSWKGAANGVAVLTPDFNILDIEGKILVIKSFKIIPYYAVAAIDMFVSDGVTTNSETIPAQGRIDRIFDTFTSTIITLKINGTPLNFFNAAFPLDVDLQNIYYKYPEKIQDISLIINSAIIVNLVTGGQSNPNVKVNMEVYLI